MTFELVHKSPVRSGGRARPVTGRKLTGQKPALKMKEVMAIRIRLQMAGKIRELALFNLGIDSKLRGCDLVRNRPIDPAFCILCGFRTLIAGMSAGGEYLEIRTTGR